MKKLPLVFLLALPVGAQTTNIPTLNSVKYLQSTQTLTSACSGFSGIPVTVSASAALASTCGVEVKPGGSIDVAIGQYLQISGPFSAGLHQVFYGPGAVYFYGGMATTEKVYPQWFGAMGNAKASGYTATSGNTSITLGQYVGSGDGFPVTRSLSLERDHPEPI